MHWGESHSRAAAAAAAAAALFGVFRTVSRARVDNEVIRGLSIQWWSWTWRWKGSAVLGVIKCKAENADALLGSYH